MSERAQKILTWILNQNSRELPLRQQTLAEEFKCSRRTIGRALKELKEAGVLIDLHKRHENRCKLYRVSAQVEKIPVVAKVIPDSSKSSLRAERSNPDNTWIATSLPRLRLAAPRDDIERPYRELTAAWFDQMHERFPCLDGIAGRPHLIHFVAQAVKDPCIDKTVTLRVWLEQQIEKEAKRVQLVPLEVQTEIDLVLSGKSEPGWSGRMLQAMRKQRMGY